MGIIYGNSAIGGGSGGSGGTGDIVAFVHVSYDVNSYVTASNGNTILTSDTSGNYIFEIPNTGVWTFENTDHYQHAVQVEYGKLYDVLVHNTALSSSDQSDVLISTWGDESTYDDISRVFAWDDLVIVGDHSTIEYDAETKSVHFPVAAAAYYPLSSANIDVTAYCVAKEYAITQNDNGLMAVPYAFNYHNWPGFYVRDGIIRDCVYGGDQSTGVNAGSKWTVLAIGIDSANKRAYFFVDGVMHNSPLSFDNSGGNVTLSCSTPDRSASSDMMFKYFGVVAGFESPNVIIENSKKLMAACGITVATIAVTYRPGDTVTVSNGSTVLTSDTTGYYTFNITYFGDFVCTATTAQITQTVSVLDPQSSFNVCLCDVTTNELPNSVSANILSSSDAVYAMHKDGIWHWLNTEIVGTNSSVSYDSEQHAIRLPQSVWARVPLSSSNKSATLYAVCKLYQVINGDLGVTGFGYAWYGGQLPSFFTRNGNIWTTVHSNDNNTGISFTSWHVLAVSIDVTDIHKYAYYYVDGVQYHSPKSFNASGAYANVGHSVPTNTSGAAACDLLVKYFGVVDGYESPETIIANMQHLMSEYGVSA